MSQEGGLRSISASFAELGPSPPLPEPPLLPARSIGAAAARVRRPEPLLVPLLLLVPSALRGPPAKGLK